MELLYLYVVVENFCGEKFLWLQVLFKYLAGKKSPGFGRRSLGNWPQITRKLAADRSNWPQIAQKSLGKITDRP